MLDADHLMRYWTDSQWAANVLMLMHLVGAMVLGLLLGYERAYHGRAAGMRTYALVCMASCAVTILVGYPDQWFGGHMAGGSLPQFIDPTRVIQGVVTGIGFLCAGVIMKDGMNISGLTTAASLWAVSAIGVLLGVGFYASALLLALLCMLSMSLLHRVEAMLPGRATLEVSLTFRPTHPPSYDVLAGIAASRGYRLLRDSLSISFADGHPVWIFCVVALDRASAMAPARLAAEIAASQGVASFSISPVRN